MSLVDELGNVVDFVTDPLGINDKVADVLKSDKHVKVSQVLATAGFTGADLATARQVSMAESGGRATATHKNSNGTQDTGLMQINDVHKPSGETLAAFRKRMMIPAQNATMGHSIYVASGNKFTAWATYNSGAYKLQGSRDATLTTKESANISDVPVVGDVVDAAGSVANGVGDLIGTLLSRDTWFRIGKGAVGLELITIGFVGLILIALKDPIKSAAKSAGKSGTAKVTKTVATVAAVVPK